MTEPVSAEGRSGGPDRRSYGLRPVLLDAAEAHRTGAVVYAEDGTATLAPGAADPAAPPAAIRVPPDRQFPAIRATFDDLNKALSRLANSPAAEGGRTLRGLYDDELERYEELVRRAHERSLFEPDYGTYVWDGFAGNLYLVAPERWHRLALVASNAKLVADPEGRLAWQEIRRRLESAVVGFAGASVGGNVLEGWLREARPLCVKVADPDWVELTNLNRGERMSLRHVTRSRGSRFDPRNPHETGRVPKAEYLAYEQHLVDPYLTIHVYSEGLTRENIDRFLGGDGAGEPPLDVLVEEVDDLDLKILARQAARRHGVDVLMLSDFGHRAHVLWNGFRGDPRAPLGVAGDDERVLSLLAAADAGDRAKAFEFVAALCGEGFAVDQYADFAAGRGEQPTGSPPQSGATAMASGAIGGKELALRVLGRAPVGTRAFAYDLMRRQVVDHGGRE